MTQRLKPLMRGWSHAVAAVGALMITIALVSLSIPHWAKSISLLIFGLTLITLYTVSAMYHIGTWPEAVRKRWRVFDHINIFLVIAGTYTPLCWNLLHGPLRVVLLSVIWGLAIGGVVVAIFTARLPRWLSPVLYIAMGWVAVAALPAFVAVSGWSLVVLLLVGGGLYTLGAVIYALKRPDPWPHIFGYHEVFHLFTIAGGLAFALAMFQHVLPN